jgi:hypothetical protein
MSAHKRSVRRYEHHHRLWCEARYATPYDTERAARHLYALRAHLRALGWLASEYNRSGLGVHSGRLLDIGAQPCIIYYMTTSTTHTVLYKDETGTSGPVTVIENAVYAADPEVAKGGFGLPYGYRPKGLTDKSWMTRAKALKVAAEYGVVLTES